MSESSLPPENAEPRKKPGRPKVLDEEMQKTVCGAIGIGCSRRTAADYAGCSVKLIRRTEKKLPAFAARLAKSKVLCEVNALKQLSMAVKEERNWRVGTWLLERRYPDRYGRRKPHSASPRLVAAVMNQLIEIVSGEVHDVEDRRRILARLQWVVERFGQYDESAEAS